MRIFRFLLPLLVSSSFSLAAEKQAKEAREYLPPPFDAYLRERVAELSQPRWQNEVTRENWPRVQAAMRKQLHGMLGLDPWPARGDLHAEVTGAVQGEGYVVEKLQFQSSPGLYVTGNLYRPAQQSAPAPTILYVCGHALVEEKGVSLGNKTSYQHHGEWYARHGFVCLIIDTIELGEIRGVHHGTYNLGRWWWASRGYTPAGVEAWNGIRALDYLETRPEVDRSRIGVTGRSGGGAYSWWIAALDERVKVAAPTAGITTLKNHILDGAIEGHCDCMFMVNTERWDFDRVAALIAPRPLLILNSDKDPIFPLDGVVEIYNRTRALYRKLGHEENVGLHIAEGPHKDTQPLNTGAFHWMDRFLKGADLMDLTDEPARRLLKPAELKVFETLPADEKVTKADEWFVPKAPELALTAEQWPAKREAMLASLRHDCFRAWPSGEGDAIASLRAEQAANGIRLTEWQFSSETPFQFSLWVLSRDGAKPEEMEAVVLKALDDEGWDKLKGAIEAGFPGRFSGVTPSAADFAEQKAAALQSKRAMGYFCPRGVGPTSFSGATEQKQTQIRRRLLLIGESLESGQAWDICQAASALRSGTGFANVPLWLEARGPMAANALYASLFISDVKRLELREPPTTHREGPTYLNVLRHLDLPQAAALAAERAPLVIDSDEPGIWEPARRLAALLGLGEERVQIRPADAGAATGRRRTKMAGREMSRVRQDSSPISSTSSSSSSPIGP